MYKFGGPSSIIQGGSRVQVGQGQRQDLQAGTVMSPYGGNQRGSVVPSTQVMLPSQIVQQQQQAAVAQTLNAAQSSVPGSNPGQNRAQPGSMASYIPVPAGTQAAPYFPTYTPATTVRRTRL